MVASPTSVGDVLSLIGNAPVLHGNQTAIEKLRASKSTFPMFGGGDSSNLMSQVMNGGSIMSNPLSALGGQLGGLVGQITSQLQSFTNGASADGSGGDPSTDPGYQTVPPGSTGPLTRVPSNPRRMLYVMNGDGQMVPALTILIQLVDTLLTPMGTLSLHAANTLAVQLPDALDLEKLLAPIEASPDHLVTILTNLVEAVEDGNDALVATYTAQMHAYVSDHQDQMNRTGIGAMAIAHVSVLFAALGQQGKLGDALNKCLVPAARDQIMGSIEATEEMFANAKAAAAATANSSGGFPNPPIPPKPPQKSPAL